MYNNNPLWYIVQPREPTTEMINTHGKELARNKLVPTRKMNIQASIMTPRDPVWEDTTYYVAPNNCTDFEFKMLLKLWGVQPADLDRLFMNVHDPPQYASTLQYTREWAELEPADRDLLWSLPQTPSGRDSIGWARDGTEVPLANMFEVVFGNRHKSPQRLQFIQLMKNLESPPEPRHSLYSLDEQELAISACFEEDPALIYYHLNEDRFMWMKDRGVNEGDENRFHTELRKLRRLYRNNSILSIVAGEPINLNGRELHTMEVEFRGLSCQPYFLLRRDGNLAHANKTPYFFIGQQTRDRSIKWITKGKKT